MPKKVIIIGAGIAGLTAGIHLQRNGYDTEIYELHSLPGGLCTAWERKGYTIDGCLHWLVGSGPGDEFYHLWDELIDMKNLKCHEYDTYMTVEDGAGKSITVYTDIDTLEREFLEKAPEDRKIILEFTGAARKLSEFRMPNDASPETMGFLEGLKMFRRMLPYIPTALKYVRVTTKDFAARCANPLMKKTFEAMFVPEMSVIFIIFTLIWFHRKSAGYPIGGSLKFAQLFEKKYRELGGKIHYRSRVTKILTKGAFPKSSATGIALSTGATYNADMVISAADGHCTLFEMLEGRFLDKKFRKYYDEYHPFPSFLQVSLGVKREFSNDPHTVVLPLERPLAVDPETSTDSLGVRIFNFDPTLAPKGRTVITVLFVTYNDRYWSALRKEKPAKYRDEKKRIADEVIDALEKRFGNVKKNIDMTDVSTPATVIRYTNNWKGSLEGWLLDPKVGFSQMKKELKGLANFYMAGQWVQPGGGVPGALVSGRQLAQLICHRDKKEFVNR
ncbi:MAG TPA: NAD(P)/FAD-dependent oxidoreductase [Spirochaetota bacterium]|mgnify:CR=1 FL=1|nr:NAD(P)/FAD-dependent oxidoreductase [Spirochaetota bacterium]